MDLMDLEGAPRPLDPGNENAIMNPLQLPHGEGRNPLPDTDVLKHANPYAVHIALRLHAVPSLNAVCGMDTNRYLPMGS
jgi:hypothetical protein